MDEITTKPKILYVEDEPLAHRNIHEYFTRNGMYEIISAYNGAEALEKLAQEPDIKCILLDYHMPDMNGLAFLAKQKQIEAIKNIPVIIQTAQPLLLFMPSLPEEAPIAGYLQKPYRFKNMVESIEQALNDKDNIIADYQARIRTAHRYAKDTNMPNVYE